MELSLKFRSEVARVSHLLAEELDQLVSAINVAWDEQHTAEDGHASVTADDAYSAAGYAERRRGYRMGEPQSYTPVLAASAGALTTNASAASYSVVGRLVTLMAQIEFTPATNGTNPLSVTVSLPIPAQARSAQTLSRVWQGGAAGYGVIDVFQGASVATLSRGDSTAFGYNLPYVCRFQISYFI